MRRPDRAVAVLVVGVYPSAFHVRWTPPVDAVAPLPRERRSPTVGSLAVDVEPVVFWDGRTPSPREQLAVWAEHLDHDEATHGRIGFGTNGGSGRFVVDELLAPLGFDADDAAVTDVVPWVFVHPGRCSQGAAMAWFNDCLGARFPPGTLPRRPKESELVAMARTPELADLLRRDVLDAEAPLVITLGNEALAALLAVADRNVSVPEVLSPKRYGRRGSIVLGGTTFDVLPLAHPGMQQKRSSPAWRAALDGWREAPG